MSILDAVNLEYIKAEHPTNAVVKEISEAAKVEDANPILIFYDVKR